MDVIRPDPNYAALGAALEYLGGKPPFRDYRAAELTELVKGQLQRRTVVVARSGPALAGYFGWNLHSTDAMRTFIRERPEMAGMNLPEPDSADPTPYVWVTTVAANDAIVVRALSREVSRANPGRYIVGLSWRPEGRLRPIRPFRLSGRG